jgi:hypothetical protein
MGTLSEADVALNGASRTNRHANSACDIAAIRVAELR